MAFEDTFRLSVHAVFTDADGKILQLKATYGNLAWGLPGGALEPSETIHEALLRECKEELGIDIIVLYMSGMYFHKAYNSHACIFKCELPSDSKIQLSSEHSEYKYFPLTEMSSIQQQRVLDCLQFDGKVKSAKF
jgi:8-oxo-dGTP pyrophosphatase MutT (NUDIX family)